MHQFFVRGNDRIPGRNRSKNAKKENGVSENKDKNIHRVFGMTARIIVDAARVAYAQEPEFEHNSHFGDEALIVKLRRMGRLSERKDSDGLTRATMNAAKLS